MLPFPHALSIPEAASQHPCEKSYPIGSYRPSASRGAGFRLLFPRRYPQSARLRLRPLAHIRAKHHSCLAGSTKQNEATSSTASPPISTSTTTDNDTASYTLPSASYVFKNATFVKSLISSDGTRRGDIYVSYVTGTTSAISALYVVNNVNGVNQVIYAIQSNVFINTAGKDFDSVGREGLFGYSLGTVRNESFSVDPLYNGGKYDAEGVIIQWYKNDNVFAVSPHSFAEMGATLAHTFKTPKRRRNRKII